jgi:RimJ/RimL family protein N-acetyltransferase
VSFELEPWNDSGLELLRLCNSPEMTEYLGGPESEDKLLDRQRRYLGYTGTGAWAFRVVFDGENVGSVNYWDDEEHYEMGWAIAPPYQRLGFAKDAVVLALAHAAATRGHTTVHALPHVDNAASNAVASSVGFVNLGQRRIEYPVGHFMMANDWVYDLAKLQSSAN